MEIDATELIGYAGSLLIIVSLTRKSLVKLRAFGLAGAAAFLVYSLIIGAYPIAVVNVIVAGIHVWFLRKLLSRRVELFTTLEVAKDSPYLLRFLAFYADDIAEHQGGFVYTPQDDQIRAFVLRDMVPAGLFIGRIHDDDTLQVELDYVIPQYRDLKVARYLYSERSGLFSDRSFRFVWSTPGSEVHRVYLERLGFSPDHREGREVMVADLGVMVGANR